MIPLKDDNPTYTVPFMTVGIIVINILVFLYELSLGGLLLNGQEAQRFIWAMGIIPYELTRFGDAMSPTPIPFYLTPFTAMFIHGGLLHVGGNMLYLWIFGNNIEDALGHLHFLFFYILCGLIATLTHVISSPSSPIPMVGASGAIAGVLGAYFMQFPAARVHVLIPFFFIFRIMHIPAMVVLGFWFLMQILNASATSGGAHSGVAWFAHIGGFIVGYILMRRYQKRRWRRFKIYRK